jgi:hypothetical protein
MNNYFKLKYSLLIFLNIILTNFTVFAQNYKIEKNPIIFKTNITVEKIVFADVTTTLTSQSNGVLRIGSGTNLSPVITDATLPAYPAVPLQTVDGITLTKSGSQISVASWISKNLLRSWYLDALHSLTAGSGFIDGPSYLFTDQNGIMTNLSSGYKWVSSGYANQVTVAATNEPTGMVAHYKMNDDAANTTIEDSAGASLNAVASQNTADMHATGKINGGIEFNGTSDIIRMNDDTCFIGTNTSVSVSLWFKKNGSGDDNQILLSKSGDGWVTSAGFIVAFNQSGNQMDVGCLNGSRLYNSAQPNDDNWHHVVAIFNTKGGSSITNISLWFDGSLKSSSLDYGTFDGIVSTNALRVGSDNGDKHFKGTIDDVRVYTNVLTQSDIEILYNSGAGTEGDGTIMQSSMYLTITNKVVSFVVSNQMLTWIAQSTNSVADLTNNQLGYAVSVDGTLTNWSYKPLLVDSTDPSNLLFTALRTNCTFSSTTNNMGVWASSNINITIKGMAAPCAP